MFLRRFWYISTFKILTAPAYVNIPLADQNWHPSNVHMSLLQIWTSVNKHFPYKKLKGVSTRLVKFNALKFCPKQQINTPYLAFSTIQTCLKFVGPNSRLERLTLSFFLDTKKQ
jgi:hypothetical protein